VPPDIEMSGYRNTKSAEADCGGRDIDLKPFDSNLPNLSVK